MSTESGRNIIWWLINDLGHYDSSSAHNSGSWTYHSEGERNIARLLKADVYQAAFPEYQEMEREHMGKVFDEQAAIEEEKEAKEKKDESAD